MESELHMHLDRSNRLPSIPDAIPLLPLSESFTRSPFFHPETQNESLIGFPMLSSLQVEPLNRSNSNNFHELCLGGTTSLASSSSLPLQQDVSSESLRAMFSTPFVPSSLSCGFDGFDQTRFLMQSELNWRSSNSGLEPLQQFSENQDVNNQWVYQNSGNISSAHPYEASRSRNELSLSLSCSDMSSHGDKDLSLGFPSSSRSSSQFSQVISGSRYLSVLQQILSEIASYSLESIDQTSFTSGLMSSSSANFRFSTNQFSDRGISSGGIEEFRESGGSFDAPAESSYRRRDVESKKSQLLSLLQLVDDRYNQCLDELHKVTSAFHAATELDPRLHACFALQTISFFYKSLRERISNEILAMGMESGSSGRDSGGRLSLEKSSFIHKQWTALQQLRRKDNQLWRPQRGLPERSVSVLRAWMFDNFLHPYPKDAEKHLLAIKSGLTRSQVSNWFINARVRLWKPLVEEMCAELNRRKDGHQNEGPSHNRRSQLRIYDYNQRFNPT